MSFASLLAAGKTFLETWTRYSPPSPYGKKIYSASFHERIRYLWQGYHVTQKNRVESQIEKGAFENRNLHIYWYPFANKKGGSHSVFLFGGKTKGCWTAEDPVILKIGSNNLWNWNDIHNFPLFPAGKHQFVKILDAWEINPKWIESRRLRIDYPHFYQKFALSLEKAKNAMKNEVSH